MSDFSNTIESGVVFISYELDSGVDFVASGDEGVIVVPGYGYGEGPYGEGTYGGGDTTIVVGNSPTVWTNIETP